MLRRLDRLGPRLALSAARRLALRLVVLLVLQVGVVVVRVLAHEGRAREVVLVLLLVLLVQLLLLAQLVQTRKSIQRPQSIQWVLLLLDCCRCRCCCGCGGGGRSHAPLRLVRVGVVRCVRCVRCVRVVGVVVRVVRVRVVTVVGVVARVLVQRVAVLEGMSLGAQLLASEHARPVDQGLLAQRGVAGALAGLARAHQSARGGARRVGVDCGRPIGGGRRCRRCCCCRGRLGSRLLLLLGLAPGPILVVGMFADVLRPQPLRLVNEGLLVQLGQLLPASAEAARNLRVVHLGVLLGHLSPLASRPHHEGVHGPLDVRLARRLAARGARRRRGLALGGRLLPILLLLLLLLARRLSLLLLLLARLVGGPLLLISMLLLLDEQLLLVGVVVVCGQRGAVHVAHLRLLLLLLLVVVVHVSVVLKLLLLLLLLLLLHHLELVGLLLFVQQTGHRNWLDLLLHLV